MRQAVERIFAALGTVAALALSGAPAWTADLTAGLTEPTGAPDAGNNFNCTDVNGTSDQPLQPGDTVNFSSTTAITSVDVAGGVGPTPGGTGTGVQTGTSGSTGSPTQLNSGGSTFSFTVTSPGATVLVVTYRSGKKQCLIVGKWGYAKKKMSTSLIIDFIGPAGQPLATVVGGWFPEPPKLPQPSTPGPTIKDND